MDEEIRRKMLTRLDQHRTMTDCHAKARRLAAGDDGGLCERRPHADFLCGPNSQKAGNLARDDRVSLTIDHDTPQVMEITGLLRAHRSRHLLGAFSVANQGATPRAGRVRAATPVRITMRAPASVPSRR
jgi:hypothetical protein